MHHIVVHVMAQNTTAGGRSIERHTDSVRGDELVEGDRIAKRLVARVPGQLGDYRNPYDEDDPEMQLLVVTELRDMDDSHTALLLDPGAEMWIRATRIERNQAMTQAEADWTVRELGDSINVTGADLRATANDDAPEELDDAAGWTQAWVDVLFGDIAAGHFDDYDDRRRMTSAHTLRLEDEYSGALVYADIELIGEESSNE